MSPSKSRPYKLTFEVTQELYLKIKAKREEEGVSTRHFLTKLVEEALANQAPPRSYRMMDSMRRFIHRI